MMSHVIRYKFIQYNIIIIVYLFSEQVDLEPVFVFLILHLLLDQILHLKNLRKLMNAMKMITLSFLLVSE